MLGQLTTVDAVVHNASLFEYDNAASFSYAALEQHMRCNTAAAMRCWRTRCTYTWCAPQPGCGGAFADQKLCNPNPDF